MTERAVAASLQVRDGQSSRPLNVQDWTVSRTGAAKEDTALLIASLLDQVRSGQGVVALDGPTLAALEQVQAIVSGTVGLDAATVDALKPRVTQPVSGTVAVSNPTPAPETGLAKAAQFPASLDTDGSLKVADVFTGGEVLPDQAGDGATVRTFTFGAPVDLVWVRAQGGGRADPFGGTPTMSQGIPCAADEPNPITVRTSSVKVVAAAGSISLWGYRS